MKKNMGIADRIIRTLIGIAIAVLYFADLISGTLAVILLIVAIVFFITSFFGRCPAYVPLGISTQKEKETKEAAD